MDELDRLAERFEAHRDHQRALAYRMLGSLSEADDAVQEAWLRLGRSDGRDIDNLAGWLTTVVARICLDMLRSRKARREEPLGPQVNDLIVNGQAAPDPGDETVLADSVGLAMLVVLDRLSPAERVAFVLHDVFAVSFDEIAAVVDRSPTTAKKLASRARRRIQGTPTVPAADLTRHRRLADVFLAAARRGDLRALLAVLDPDLVRRADRTAIPAHAQTELHGARAVAEETLTNARLARFARSALVNGSVGIVVAPRGRLLLVLRLTVEDERITGIDVTADPGRLREFDLAVLDEQPTRPQPVPLPAAPPRAATLAHHLHGG